MARLQMRLMLLRTSASVLNALKDKGEAEMGIFTTFVPNKPSLDRNARLSPRIRALTEEGTRQGGAEGAAI